VQAPLETTALQQISELPAGKEHGWKINLTSSSLSGPL